ncbi:peptidylprolyl isomerase [Streptomyces sp. NPDC021093]|uniref:peptidylprolyl isomerase n=1 Tax=Streptomyces sp. NPDC021093 TaxID=3365112 RepID=UPI0037A370AC
MFADENLAGATCPAGTVAMANSGPNTHGCQFFLVYSDSPLPPNYTPFGRVTEGLDVMQNIAAAGVQGGDDGAPAAEVTLNSVSTSADDPLDPGTPTPVAGLPSGVGIDPMRPGGGLSLQRGGGAPGAPPGRPSRWCGGAWRGFAGS